MSTTRFRRHVLADQRLAGAKRPPAITGVLAGVCAFALVLMVGGAAPSQLQRGLVAHLEHGAPLVLEPLRYRADNFNGFGEVWRVPTDRKVVALTFDDGPYPFYTTLLLHELDRSGVHATFFLVGRNAQEFPELTQDIVEAGNEIGNHTFNHYRLTQLSDEQIRAQITQAGDFLEQFTGRRLLLFRPPHGRYDHRVATIARQLGYYTVFWSDSPEDTKNIAPSLEIHRVLRQARPGAIILLHSGQYKTIVSLPVIIDQLRSQGYSFETVSQLLADQ